MDQCLFHSPSRDILWQQRETDERTNSQSLFRDRVYVRALNQIPSLRGQEITWLLRQKDFKTQRRYRIPGETGHLKQLCKAHKGSQRLTQQAQGLHGSIPCPLCIYYTY